MLRVAKAGWDMEPARKIQGSYGIGEAAVSADPLDLAAFPATGSTIYRERGKRLLDAMLALLLLGALLPVLLIVALGVLILSGWPVWYRSRRVGRGGAEFWMFKFRTMRRDADKHLAEMLEAAPSVSLEFLRRCKITNDPRVTGLGGILRATSLDELPQLLNVVAGQMSLVGPRPVPGQELVDQYGSVGPRVLEVRPGMTGLWQVSGRSDTSYSQRVQYDCQYVAEHSLSMDVRILARTAVAVLARRGAQ